MTEIRRLHLYVILETLRGINSRYIFHKDLKRFFLLEYKALEQLGFKLFIGVENEFRLFDKVTKKPLLSEIRFFDHFNQSTIMLPYFRQLRKQLKRIGENDSREDYTEDYTLQ